MERRKGSFILNDTTTMWQGRAQAIHVIADVKFASIRDSKNQTARYYLSSASGAVNAGAVIAARDGSQFVAISITGGALEIIF